MEFIFTVWSVLGAECERRDDDDDSVRSSEPYVRQHSTGGRPKSCFSRMCEKRENLDFGVATLALYVRRCAMPTLVRRLRTLEGERAAQGPAARPGRPPVGGAKSRFFEFATFSVYVHMHECKFGLCRLCGSGACFSSPSPSHR